MSATMIAKLPPAILRSGVQKDAFAGTFGPVASAGPVTTAAVAGAAAAPVATTDATLAGAREAALSTTVAPRGEGATCGGVTLNVSGCSRDRKSTRLNSS